MNDTPADARALYGTWRLIATSAVDGNGGPLADPWGPAPMGSLVLEPSGRMMAVLCDGRPQMPAGETRAYSSYCGTFTFDGRQIATTVDAASDIARIGSVQRRGVALRDGHLVLFPPPDANGGRREIVWALVAAFAPQ
jgi:hypothetical protein